MFSHKHLCKLAGFSNTEAFSVMQSKRQLLRTGVYMGNCRFYGLSDGARAILFRRLRDLDIREAIAATMIDRLPLGALEDATEALSSGKAARLVVTFTRGDEGITGAVNAAPERSGTTLTLDLTGDFLAALETKELTA